MLKITDSISIPQHEITFHAIRAQGAGGQNVNKVSSAIHLRFDIQASSLPAEIKQRLHKTSDTRRNKEGIIVIKAQQFRTQEKNKIAALDRLKIIVLAATLQEKVRIATRPTKGSRLKRLESKTKAAKTKTLRKKVTSAD